MTSNGIPNYRCFGFRPYACRVVTSLAAQDLKHYSNRLLDSNNFQNHTSWPRTAHSGVHFVSLLWQHGQCVRIQRQAEIGSSENTLCITADYLEI